MVRCITNSKQNLLGIHQVLSQCPRCPFDSFVVAQANLFFAVLKMAHSRTCAEVEDQSHFSWMTLHTSPGLFWNLQGIIKKCGRLEVANTYI